MEYDLSIRQDNIEAYLDIAKDIGMKKNGLFTFILRVNNGKICDYNQLEYTDVKSKYLRLKEVIRTEYVVLHCPSTGTGGVAVRPGDSERDSS